MRRLCRSTAWILAVALLLGSGAARAAEDRADAAALDGPNIRITLTTGKVEADPGPTRKTYRLLTRDDGPPARLLVGWRMPIPTTRSSGESDAASAQTAYVYQNVGMSAHLETRLLGGDRILVRGMIEISGRKGDAEVASDPDRPPVIGTFQQDLSVVLRDGEPLRVAELPDPEGTMLFLELLAEVLR